MPCHRRPTAQTGLSENAVRSKRNHVRDWQAVSAAERVAAAWDMVVEAWKLKGRDPDELEFQRTVRCVKRGGKLVESPE